MMFEIQKEDFFKKYNIQDDYFRKSLSQWEDLLEIANDYESLRSEHENIVDKYVSTIKTCSRVHSMSWRIKDTEHLLEKIIRKNYESGEISNSIKLNNYRERITDLVGIRILLLFKEDWENVHDFLMTKYKSMLFERPYAYIRKGDDENIYKDKVDVKEKKAYRSVHYVIKTDMGSCVEVQVRTLYEEAWGEIDHELRYPYDISNEMISNYMNLLNRLTGMGDEMSSFCNRYISFFKKANEEGITSENKVYNYIVDRLKSCEDIELKNDIMKKIESAEEYHLLCKNSDLINYSVKKMLGI